MSIRGIFSTISRSKVIPAVVVVVAVAAFSGWYIWHKNNSWVSFESQQYGLKFIYPKDWGAVSVYGNKISASPDDKTITSYSVSFGNGTINSGPHITAGASLIMQPDNYSPKEFCDDSKITCITPQVLSKDSIQKTLSKSKAGLVAYDDKSYATLTSDSKNRLASELDVYGIVSIPKLHVSAVRLSYNNFSSQYNSTNCPTDKFSTSQNTGCITKSIYDIAVKVINSIKPVK